MLPIPPIFSTCGRGACLCGLHLCVCSRAAKGNGVAGAKGAQDKVPKAKTTLPRAATVTPYSMKDILDVTACAAQSLAIGYQ